MRAAVFCGYTPAEFDGLPHWRKVEAEAIWLDHRVTDSVEQQLQRRNE